MARDARVVQNRFAGVSRRSHTDSGSPDFAQFHNQAAVIVEGMTGPKQDDDIRFRLRCCRALRSVFPHWR